MDVHPYACIDAITTQAFSILTKDFIDKFQGELEIEPALECRRADICKSVCYRTELRKFRSDLYELTEFRPVKEVPFSGTGRLKRQFARTHYVR
jgi:hypothetical protein